MLFLQVTDSRVFLRASHFLLLKVKLCQSYSWVLSFHYQTVLLRLVQWEHTLKILGHGWLHVLLLAVTCWSFFPWSHMLLMQSDPFHHCLTFEPCDCIEFLVEIMFPLRECIILNISLSGILSIYIIIVYHCFSHNFIISTSLSLTSTNARHLQLDVFILVAFFTENSWSPHIILNSAYT